MDSRLAILHGRDAPDEARRRRARAVEVGRRLGDTTSRVLAFAAVPFTPRRIEAARADYEDLRELPIEQIPAWLLVDFVGQCEGFAIGLGDREAAEGFSQRIRDRAERTHDSRLELRPFIDTALRFPTMDGRLAEAAEARASVLALAEELGRPAQGIQLSYAMSLEYLGRWEEIFDWTAAAEATGARISGAWLARYLVHAGRTDEARTEFSESHRMSWVDDGDVPVLQLVALIQAAIALGERDLVKMYADALEPVAWWGGPVTARPLGAAALLLGDRSKARGYFELALEVTAKLRHRPESALAHLDVAEVLADDGEPVKAASHLEIAIRELSDMGMRPGLERALRLRLRLQGVDPSTSALSSIVTVGEAVVSERPSLEPATAPDGTVTILCTDIELSTELNEKLGDDAWLDVLRVHNACIREQVAAHHGVEVKSQGDGFMLAFPSPDDALRCAIDIQRAVAKLDVRVRAGLHSGPVVKEGEDFYGRNVTLAFRIADAARGGEILASDALRALTADATFTSSRDVELKGFSGSQVVHVVELTQDPS